VVSADRMDDFRIFAVFLGILHADESVAAFLLVADRLADVVQNSGAACFLLVEPQLGRHHARQESDFERMLQNVLRKAETIF